MVRHIAQTVALECSTGTTDTFLEEVTVKRNYWNLQKITSEVSLRDCLFYGFVLEEDECFKVFFENMASL